MLIRAAFILVFTACTGLACAGDDDPSSIAPAFSASELSQPPTDGWLTNGGDLFNRRFSPLTEINQDNVSTLRPVWRTHLNGSGVGPQFSGEAQPIIYGNVMYVVTGANDVFALSVDTGEVLWTYEANLDTAINTICCGWPGMKATITGDGWMGITPAGQKIDMTSLDIWNQVGVDVLARMKDLSIARQPYSLKN